MRPLHNRDWGFATNCFVCEPRNERGLHVPFFTDGIRVVASFLLDDAYSGAPNYVHGGILLAVLDEAMAWATIALAGKAAVTRRISSEFIRPVRVGLVHHVEALIDEVDETITTRAFIRDDRERVCVAGRATFVPLAPAQLRDASGVEPDRAIVEMLARGR